MEPFNRSGLADFYRDHVQESLLPFWARALDPLHGGIYTCFNNRGEKLVSTRKYAWSQGRFLWLWSKIASTIAEDRLDGDLGSYHAHLEKTARFLEKHVFMQNGNCAFLLSETGEMIESAPGQGYDTSIYADCFVVIGLAGYAALARDRRRYDTARALYDRIRKRLQSGNFRTEPFPVPEGYRAHSIPMIMLNVSQELLYAAENLQMQDSSDLSGYAIGYMTDIMENFCVENDRIAELLPDDPSEADSLLARHLNPGHTLESMWFVMHSAIKNECSWVIEKAARTTERALRTGWDEVYGGLFRFVDKGGGKPTGRKLSFPFEKVITESWDMKLWWPHSEALYTTLLVYLLTEDETFWSWHEKIRHYVFRTFPHPDPQVGEWIQIRDRRGRPVEKVAALPVKDPFHILRNMLLILDILDKGKEGILPVKQ